MLGLLLLTGCGVFAQVEPAAPVKLTAEQIAAQVRRWERQLDDDELARRDEAEDQLIKLGPRVLDSLTPITPGMSTEMQERLSRIRQALEDSAAEATTQPSHVSLKGRMPASDALEAISKQTGNRFGGHQNRLELVEVDFDKTPFWQALDEVLDQAELTVDEISGDDGQMFFVARPEGDVSRAARASYNGVFRSEAVRIVAARNLRSPALGGLSLTVQVAWEPRAMPISLSFPFETLKVTDDRDRQLAIDNVGRPEANIQRNMTLLEIELPIPLPDRDVKRLKSVRCTMDAMLLGRKEKFEFTDLENVKDVKLQKAGATVTFQQLRKNVELYEVRMRARFDKPDQALESHRGWHLQNEAYLIDPDGNKVAHVASESFRLVDDEIGRVFLFDLPKGPVGYKFVYATPSKIVRKPIEFELKEIDLP